MVHLVFVPPVFNSPAFFTFFKQYGFIRPAEGNDQEYLKVRWKVEGAVQFI